MHARRIANVSLGWEENDDNDYTTCGFGVGKNLFSGLFPPARHRLKLSDYYGFRFKETASIDRNPVR